MKTHNDQNPDESKSQTDEIAPKADQPKVARNGVEQELKIFQVLTPLNLRSKPDTKAEILLVLKKGSAVQEVSFNDEWSFVRTDENREGWVMKEYLKEV